MGSKCRIANRLRTNDDYRAAKAWLDQHDLPHSVHAPTGKGHPFLIITMPDGAEVKHHVAGTPRGGGNSRGAVGHLRKSLRDAGYDY